MSIQFRILSLIGISLIFQTVSSCQAGLTISQPAKERKHLTTPTDLIVSQTGCPSLGPGEIKTWSEHVEQGQIDLTNKFVYENGQWSGMGIDLPLGTQTFTVEWVEMKPASTCWEGQRLDSRMFTVYEPACIRGQVLGVWDDNDPGTPLASASIEVSLTQDSEVVGQAKSNQDGYFCIDTIPLGFLVDIQIEHEEIYRISKHSFDPAATEPRTCLQPEFCPNITCRGKYDEN